MHYCTTDWAWYHCPALRLTAVPTCRPCCIQTYWWQSANKHTNVTLGPCHTRNKVEQLYRATLLLNKVAQATVNFPSENDRQTNFASSDTDDDIIISSALLIASTLYQRHQANVRKHTRNSRRIETVSLQQFSCSTHQKLGNSPCQTGNFDEQRSSTTKLLNFVACLTSALQASYQAFSTTKCHCINKFMYLSRHIGAGKYKYFFIRSTLDCKCEYTPLIPITPFTSCSLARLVHA